MTEVVPKQKVSLSLDADIVAEFERGGPLSTQINEALRAEFERRRHQAALGKLVERLKAEFDGLDTEEDRAAIARYREMLR
jgi:hypothetical protein